MALEATGHHLYDADTDEDLGAATPAQVEASDQGSDGLFWIDTSGSPVRIVPLPVPEELRLVYTNQPRWCPPRKEDTCSTS